MRYQVLAEGSWDLRVRALQKADVMNESSEHLFRWDLQKYVPIRSEQPSGQSLNSLLPQEAVGAAWEHSEKRQDWYTDPGIGDHSQPACGSPHTELCSELPPRLCAWLWV